MGQKVHPYGFRIGYNRTWHSRWYAEKDYLKFLHTTTYVEALKGREFAIRLTNRTGERIAVALAVDRGLVRRACLQVVAADQSHVGGLGRRADLLLLRRCTGHQGHSNEGRKCASHHGVSPFWSRLYRAGERLS